MNLLGWHVNNFFVTLAHLRLHMFLGTPTQTPGQTVMHSIDMYSVVARGARMVEKPHLVAGSSSIDISTTGILHKKFHERSIEYARVPDDRNRSKMHVDS